MNRAAPQSHHGAILICLVAKAWAATATDKPDVLQHGILVEPSGTSQEPTTGVGEAQSLSSGNYWNLLGMRAVLNTSCTPNTILGKVFGACWNLAGTYSWRGQTQLLLFGTYWNLFGTCAFLNTSCRPNTIFRKVQ